MTIEQKIDKSLTFNTEEMVELSAINHYNLRAFIDERRTNIRELKTFEKYSGDDLDVSDTKIRALCFINGVRKKLLRYQMRVKVDEARKQGRQSLFVPEKVQIIFDPNRISLDNLLETAEFTEDFMKTRKINLLAAFQQMEEINKRLGD